MQEVNLGCAATCTSPVWVDKIHAAIENSDDAAIFTDGSRGENSRTPRGWSADFVSAFEGPSIGGKYLEEGATVWDGEVAGMAEALLHAPHDRGS